MVLGVHFAPVRSAVPAPDASMTLFRSRTTSLTASAIPGVCHVRDHADALVLNPPLRNRGPDVDLVLVVARDHFHSPSDRLAAVVFNGHLRGQHGTWSLVIRVYAGHIVEHPDANGIQRRLRVRRSYQEKSENDGKCGACRHLWFPLAPFVAALVSMRGAPSPTRVSGWVPKSAFGRN